MWVLDYLPDLESDFSVFHRIGDIYSMPAARFFLFAERICAYAGAMRMHVEAEAAKAQSPLQVAGSQGKKVVGSLAEMPIRKGERVVIRRDG